MSASANATGPAGPRRRKWLLGSATESHDTALGSGALGCVESVGVVCGVGVWVGAYQRALAANSTSKHAGRANVTIKTSHERATAGVDDERGHVSIIKKLRRLTQRMYPLSNQAQR